MTQKSFSLWGGVAAVSLYWGYGFMTDYGQNAFCRLLDDAEYREIEDAMSPQVMQAAQEGVAVRFQIDTDLPKDGSEVLIITLGSLADPDGVEYRGPLRDEVTLTVGLAADENSFPVFPSVHLFNPKRQAVCTWEAEQGFDVERGEVGVVRKLVLRASRREGQMGSIDIMNGS